ncbi:hypothetical protein LIER_10840 [Lithospermum erythrorhizon]|uniref:Uncharacterized protein n=1 Tax=Lithospermum erythrorhizon TaxID=34254 RepID=A0AAV3PPT9_LITER
MTDIKPNLPLFFNMHSTSHSGLLTSFSSLSDYNIFVEDKSDMVLFAPKSLTHQWKVSYSTQEVLTAALSSVEPRKVPFSTMKGKRIPLFKRVDVVTKTTSETPTPASVGASSTLGALRGYSYCDRRLFQGERKRFCPQGYNGYSATYLNLPYTLLEGYEVIEKSKLGMALDAFHATHPLLLEGIGRPYEEYSDPLELQGVIAKNLVRAMNASHVLARTIDRLDVDLGLSREGERAFHFKMQELEKENEALLRNQV